MKMNENMKVFENKKARNHPLTALLKRFCK